MSADFSQSLAAWQLPDEGPQQDSPLLDRIEAMIRDTLLAGHFGDSATTLVCGLQYHLGGARDTRELANLAALTPADSVLDVCSYLGGPAVQLASEYGCRVTGVDISERAVTAARRIAALSGLGERLEFQVGNATQLPFPDATFTVVWNQGSLSHEEAWLQEFDRVLAKGGRVACTFAIRGEHPDAHSPRWSLAEVGELMRGLGYRVDHLEEVTKRDISQGWEALLSRLDREEAEFAAALGRNWVSDARREFEEEIRQMRAGRWGNGRLVATKL
jgi:ubiquinone/menaquinone biosynthesis C-methylase UbiE